MLIAAALLVALCPAPAPRAQAFTDTGGEPAAIQSAIDYVTNLGWMEGYDDGTFRPTDYVTRIDAARGLVYAFGHDKEESVPGIYFPDLPSSDPRYRWANLAFYHGLMDITAEHHFLPDEPVIYERLALGVTHGLGLDTVAANILNIVPGTPYYGGCMVVFHDLHLKYYDRDYPFSVRIWPGGPYPRGNMAFTLQKLATLDSWRTDYLRNTFTAGRCQPPAANDLQQTALEYGFERLGQAYLYGGESEAEGGFDCSGFVYNTLSMRMGYRMMRVADDQARDERYLYVNREGLKPGDNIFWYDEEGGGSTGHIGHAGMYVGNGLFIHSTGSNAGVSLDCLDTNSYWSSHFAWGRRVVGGPYYNRFDEFLLLSNPSEQDANVRVEYLRPTEAPLSRDYYVAPHSRATIGVDSLLPYDEVSLHVTSDTGIVAERAMYFDYGGSMPGGDASIGASAPATGWFLAEGCTYPNFSTWLLLANPSDYETWARVSYLREEGEPIEQEYYLAPRSRTSVNVNNVPGIGYTGVSMRVESTNGVGFVAERAMYFDYYGIKGGSGGMGITQAAAEWFLAEGIHRRRLRHLAAAGQPLRHRRDGGRGLPPGGPGEGHAPGRRPRPHPLHHQRQRGGAAGQRVRAGGLDQRRAHRGGARHVLRLPRQAGRARLRRLHPVLVRVELRRGLHRQGVRHLAAAGQPGRGRRQRHLPVPARGRRGGRAGLRGPRGQPLHRAGGRDRGDGGRRLRHPGHLRPAHRGRAGHVLRLQRRLGRRQRLPRRHHPPAGVVLRRGLHRRVAPRPRARRYSPLHVPGPPRQGLAFMAGPNRV